MSYTPDMIIGRDIIRNLGLTLNFQHPTPIIEWDEIMVPMVKRVFWTQHKLDETFRQQSKATLEEAKEIFESHIQSMIAAGYGKTKPTDLIPTYLSALQKQQLTELLKNYESIFSGKLGKLPGKPVKLQFNTNVIKSYHGRPYQVPQSLLPLLRAEVDRLCNLRVIKRFDNPELAAQDFAVSKKKNQSGLLQISVTRTNI